MHTDGYLEKAITFINQYCEKEFGSKADFSNLERVDLAYTTTEDDQHEIQVDADLVNCRLTQYLDGKVVKQYRYDDLESFVNDELRWLDFDELVRMDDDAFENNTESINWFPFIINRLQDWPSSVWSGVWSDGDKILCKSEEVANALADMLTQLYASQNEEIVAQTGCYSPEEDIRDGEEDDHTGWWYVTID